MGWDFIHGQLNDSISVGNIRLGHSDFEVFNGILLLLSEMFFGLRSSALVMSLV